MSVILVLLILFLTVVALGLVLAAITRPELRVLVASLFKRQGVQPRGPEEPQDKD